MREHPDVTAVADRDARVHRRLHARSLGCDARRFRCTALFPSTVLQHRITGRHGRHQHHAALLHQLEDFGRAIIAMVDGLHAGENRAAHAFRRRRVRHHVPTAHLRNLDDERHLGLRKARSRRAVRPPAVVGVDLDPVGAAPDLVAHDTRQLLRASSLLGALRHIHFRRKTTGSVHAAHHDRARGDHHPRPFDDALLHRLPEPHIGIASALGAEVTQRGEAGAQRALHVHRRTRHAQAQWLLQHLIVPRRLVVRMQQHVRMQVDHAGHQRHARQVDDHRVRWRLHARRHADGGDASVLHEHHGTDDRWGTRAIEHTRRPQQHRQRGRRGWLLRRDQRRHDAQRDRHANLRDATQRLLQQRDHRVQREAEVVEGAAVAAAAAVMPSRGQTLSDGFLSGNRQPGSNSTCSMRRPPKSSTAS